MNARNPGFTAARLIQAREARGYSKSELARLLSLTPAAVSAYETGVRVPSPDTVDAIAHALEQPVAFFSRPAPRFGERKVFYRSFSAATRTARLRAQAKMSLLWDAVDYVQELVDLPPVVMPAVGELPGAPEEITQDMIEAAAVIARRHWKLGENPAPNLVWLLEESGAIVVRHDLGTDRLDAFSEWREADARPYFMLNSIRRNAFRSRADVAHEIGHVLLHRHVAPACLDDDDTFKLLEDQAWRFAQAFLLPEQAFLRDLSSLNLDALRALKPKWKVSIAFMLHRVHRLGILNDDKYTNYRKYLAQRGWLKVEPYDLETEPERPLLLAQVLEFLIEQKVQTPDQIASGVGFNAELLEQLTHVQPGFFSLERRSRPWNLKMPGLDNTG
ncbi:ImmA/IrrE family metallo-endopeptidase [Deinococcus sp. SDU3-2]|uniref:ImmA/IrrE family metallo-endopeptidase n=1 Tax=Deinococcus terrestris TaxID=2651870 RepID=A0A7X1NZ21_9DEIO|nr:XRE family transcriptional regulator [Deinococcus terrestris]MPY67949.1 ImmA/IrrE family metallo-endopeptidase [Deinococcus terrestris]